MKKVLLGIAFLGLASSAIAATVNPTSNVLADDSATGNTLVLRDSSAGIAGTLTTNLSVSAKQINSSAVSVTQMLIDLPSNKIVCVTTMRQLGFCTGAIAATANGYCSCSVSVP